MSAVQMKRWTREGYDRMIEAGIFAPGERVELLDGEILATSPQSSSHSRQAPPGSLPRPRAFVSGALRQELSNRAVLHGR
jgi:hypothetical protein